MYNLADVTLLDCRPDGLRVQAPAWTSLEYPTVSFLDVTPTRRYQL